LHFRFGHVRTKVKDGRTVSPDGLGKYEKGKGKGRKEKTEGL